MNEEAKMSFWESCAGSTARSRRSDKLMVAATFIWAVVFTGVSLLLKREIVTPGPLAWFLAALPAVLGVVVVVIFARHLRAADELARLIQLEALALGFGGTLFGLYAYQVLERIGAPVLDISDVGMVMVAIYMLGLVVSWRRYR